VAQSSCRGDSQVLLQLQKAKTISVVPESLDTLWFDWQRRVLPSRSRSLSTFHLDGANHEEPTKSQVWNALGGNWWMAYLDGKDHWKGKHGYDHQRDKKHMVNNFYELEEREFKSSFTHDDWDIRWNTTNLAQLNSRLLPKRCATPSCEDLYIDDYDPAQYKLDSPVPTPLPFQSNSSMRIRKLDELLSAYYSELDASRVANSGTSVLRKMFPLLLKTYAQMALIHPFADGNSRTRTTFLQTELVRIGGHPVMMYDNAWFVYWARSFDNLKNIVLQGWCNWEVAVATGSSPYVAPNNITFGNRSYDADRGACLTP